MLGIAALPWLVTFSLLAQDASKEEITDKAEKKEIEEAAVAKPVSAEPIQIFGWRENVTIKGAPE